MTNLVNNEVLLKKDTQEIIKNNIIIFIIAIFILQCFTVYFLSKYNTTSLRVPLILGLYIYLSNTISPFQYLESGFIYSFLAYVIFKLFSKIFNNIIIETITIFIIIFSMLYKTSIINIPSIKYAMTGIKLIPELGYNYIFYYLGGIIFVIILIDTLRYIQNILLPLVISKIKSIKI